MISGIYVSALGMLTNERKQDVIANNLANINTTGFKKQNAIFKALKQVGNKDPERENLEYEKVILDDIYTEWNEGAMTYTSNPLDMAIKGDGFFVVETDEGEKLTRSGNFSIDENYQLVDSNGFPVMGNGGPIIINGNDVSIGKHGEINVDGNIVDNIRVVQVPNKNLLIRNGYNLYTVPEGVDAVDMNIEAINIQSGRLEESNVNTVKEMVNMIAAMRLYETNQRAIHTQDGTLDKLINEIGRV